MPKENHRASEVEKAGEIGGTPLIPCHESPRVLQPGKESFDFPATFIPAQGASILRAVDPVGPMRSDRLDTAVSQALGEPITVIGRITDEPCRIVGQETGV